MRYAFVKLKNPTNDIFVFMEAAEYDRYSNYDIFKNNAVSFTIYDDISIGLFPLMFKEDEILYFNPLAARSLEIELSDTRFGRNSVKYVGYLFGCDNCK